jgi:tRNA nucleotidyltransferase (CCA-adding enzyme)
MNEPESRDLLRRLPPNVVETLCALGKLAGARKTSAFVVGGVVRDLVLGIPNDDLDIVVEEPAEAFAAAAAAALGGSVKAHTRFGTAILMLPGGLKIDLATARSETYVRPGALPDVRPGAAIRDDLRRRDFTINSMAIRLGPDGLSALLDPYSGMDDLREGSIRVLTDRSFEDDPTRVLRAVRFAARFGFDLEDHTEELLREGVRRGFLSTVSGERIMNELALILSEREPWPPVRRLVEWGVLAAVETSWQVPLESGAVFERVQAVLDPVAGGRTGPGVETWRVYFLALIEPVQTSDRERILKRLRSSGRLRDLARDLGTLEDRARDVVRSAAPPRSAVFHALAGLGTEVLLLEMALRPGAAADRIALYLDLLRNVRPSLSGRDVEALGIPRGPAVGKILAELLDARLDGAVVSREEERALAERLVRLLDEKSKS